MIGFNVKHLCQRVKNPGFHHSMQHSTIVTPSCPMLIHCQRSSPLCSTYHSPSHPATMLICYFTLLVQDLSTATTSSHNANSLFFFVKMRPHYATWHNTALPHGKGWVLWKRHIDVTLVATVCHKHEKCDWHDVSLVKRLPCGLVWTHIYSPLFWPGTRMFQSDFKDVSCQKRNYATQIYLVKMSPLV